MSQPITIDGEQNTVTIKQGGSVIRKVAADVGSPFKQLFVKNDAGKVLFTAPPVGPDTIMWHVVIE